MLILNRLMIPSSAQRHPITVQYLTLVSSPSNTSGYSFSSVSLGPEDPSRRIVCVVHWQRLDIRSLTSATIDGQAMTIHNQTAVSGHGIAACSRLYPTGSTATIAISLNNTVNSAAVAVYAVYKELLGVHDSGTDGTVSGNSLSVNTDGNGGLVILGASSTTDGSWSGSSVERYDTIVDNHWCSGATAFPTIDNTFTFTGSNTLSGGAMIGLSIY